MPKYIALTTVTVLLAACSTPTDPSARESTTSRNPQISFKADHTVPGTPGEANCRGQTTAYLAQASKNGEENIPEGFRGLGGVSRSTGLTVQEIKAIVDAFCATV